MAAEPELEESADPRALVRGDPAAVRATVAHLSTLAAGCAATASHESPTVPGSPTTSYTSRASRS